MKCTECNGSGEAIYFVETDRDENTVTIKERKCICRTCNGSGEMPMTNADRIRAMTDEELAHELALIASWDRKQYEKAKSIGTEKVMMDWLKQPCEGE